MHLGKMNTEQLKKRCRRKKIRVTHRGGGLKNRNELMKALRKTKQRKRKQTKKGGGRRRKRTRRGRRRRTRKMQGGGTKDADKSFKIYIKEGDEKKNTR